MNEFEWIWDMMRKRRCKYSEKCPLYSADSKICNNTGGVLYLPTRYSLCYEAMEGRESQ